MGSIFYYAMSFWKSTSLSKEAHFGSKIRYEDVVEVEVKYFSTGDMLAGYRVMGARDGIEIHYQTAFMGSIRISPEHKHQFLQELERHAPHARFIKS